MSERIQRNIVNNTYYHFPRMTLTTVQYDDTLKNAPDNSPEKIFQKNLVLIRDEKPGDIHNQDHNAESNIKIFEEALKLGVKKIVCFCPEEVDGFGAHLADIVIGYINKNYPDTEFNLVSGGFTNNDFPCFAQVYNSLFKLCTNVVYWPDYFGYTIVQYYLHSPHNRSVFPEINIQYPKKIFTCLNQQPKVHRAILVDYLYRYGLFDYGYISWLAGDSHLIGHVAGKSYKYRWWTPDYLYLDWSPDSGHDFNQRILPLKEYKDSVFSIVNESDYNIIFLTEKTFIPILCKRAFIINGAPNINKFLKTMGFKLFDEVIDYSFDSIIDEDLRIETLCLEIKKLTELDPIKLYRLLRPKIEHNFNTLINNVENKTSISNELKSILNIDNPWMSSIYRPIVNAVDGSMAHIL